MWRIKVLALAASVTIGCALAMGLHAGSSEAPVPHELPSARAAFRTDDQVDIDAAILVHLAGADKASWATESHSIVVSRTLRDTCPRPHARRAVSQCGFASVGRMSADVEASLAAVLARRDVVAVFVDQADDSASCRDRVHSVHAIVFDSSGVVAADGDIQCAYGDRFLFSRVDGRWHLKNTSMTWIA